MTRSIFPLSMVLLAALATPASALTLTCTPQSLGSWQDGELAASTLASDDPSATPFTIDLATGAFTHAGDVAHYEILSPGSAEADANSDFVALGTTPSSLLRIKLEGDAWSFLRDYGRTLEIGTCAEARP